MYIEKFLNLIHAAESKGSREVIIPLREAKAVHTELTKILLKVSELQQLQADSEQVIDVEIKGSSF